MNNALVRPLLAEFLGTLTLVFIGAMAVIVAPQNGGVVVPALAHGLVLVALASAYGQISGGHFNPAVTLAMLVGGRIDLLKSVLYWVVQFAGAVVASVLLGLLLGSEANGYGQTMGSLTTSATMGQAALFEAILVFFLVTTIYQTAIHGRAGAPPPVAIGFTLAACILAGGAFTGASLNPARTFGPALMAGEFSYLVPYFVGQFVGGAVAGFVNAYILK